MKYNMGKSDRPDVSKSMNFSKKVFNSGDNKNIQTFKFANTFAHIINNKIIERSFMLKKHWESIHNNDKLLVSHL